MNNTVAQVIDRVVNKTKKYNILTFDTHERYQEQLCKTGHNFYAFRYDGCKEWDDSYAARPNNYYGLPANTFFQNLDFDFILSQSKFGQFQVAAQLQQRLQVPIISLEHTLPIDGWPPEQLEAFRGMSGNVNVFISEFSKRAWGFDPSAAVIHHSVNSDLFNDNGPKVRKSHVLSVVNDFVNRDYCCNFQGWKRITEGLETRLVGNTPGLSEAAKDTNELVKEYQNSKVFLNTSTVSPVPTALLEAMSCGCAVVSTATCMIPEIIENGVNGFISNDEEELRKYIDMLLENDALAENMGQNARRTIVDNFSQEEFIANWNQLFDLVYEAIR